MSFKNLLLAALLLVLPATGRADLLTVATDDRQIVYTEDSLAALPWVTIRTANDYIEDSAAFSGPLLRDVLAPLDLARGTVLRAVALNDYSVDIPLDDALDYDVIVARTMNGTPMRIRDKGPLWLMYPLDDHFDLTGTSVNHKLIWQLVQLVAR